MSNTFADSICQIKIDRSTGRLQRFFLVTIKTDANILLCFPNLYYKEKKTQHGTTSLKLSFLPAF